MGCDFSVQLLWGVKIPGTSINWDEVSIDEKSCDYEQFKPLHSYNTGGYTDIFENDWVFGVHFDNFERYGDPKAVEIPLQPLEVTTEHKKKAIELISKYPDAVLGLWVLPNWS